MNTLVNKINLFVKAKKPPYIKLFKTINPNIQVWIVDGKYVRNNLTEDFTNFGQHFQDGLDVIPKNEIWLDKENVPDDWKFYIKNAYIQHKLGIKGKPYLDQYLAGMKAERKMRRNEKDLKELTRRDGKLRLPKGKDFHVRLWKRLEDKDQTKIWIVDGKKVRDVLDPNFTEGCHEFVYEYCPQGEVWIDNDLMPEERGYVLVHELHERNLMAQGMGYHKAHQSSLKVELYCRKHPEMLHEKLMDEGFTYDSNEEE